jgi:Tfp pilus assembly protein PilN
MAVRIPLNLASVPFRRDRPLLVATIAACALLAIVLLSQIGTIVAHRHEAADTRAAIERTNAQLTRLNAEQRKFDAILARPENAEVLERSLFLNTLIERKAISWTKLFHDLQGVVPPTVRLVSVRLPEVDNQNQVLLDVVVSAKEVAPVLDLFRKFESSPQFGPTTLVNTLPPSQTDPYFRYHVTVSYAQKL